MQAPYSGNGRYFRVTVTRGFPLLSPARGAQHGACGAAGLSGADVACPEQGAEGQLLITGTLPAYGRRRLRRHQDLQQLPRGTM